MKREYAWWVGLACCVAVIYVGLVLLKQRAVAPLTNSQDEPKKEEIYEEDYVRRHAVTVISSVASDRGNLATPARTPRITRLQEAEPGEGFEAEKYRAFGDSSIFGVVRGPDRRRLEGATVQLYDADPMTKNPPLRETVSDTSGSYTLDKVNAAERLYILVARAEGCAPFAKMVSLRGEPLEENISLAQGVECSGVVVDALTSQPLPRATVYYPSRGLIVRPLGTIETSPMGEFRFPYVTKGMVKVRVEYPGYHTRVVAVDTPTTTAVIALVPGGATIRGETISRLTQKPVGRTKVALLGQDLISTTLSDEDGKFEFTDLPAGQFVLVGIRGMAGPTEKVTLAERETREGIHLIVPAPIFVSGRVVHALNGNPLAGIRLYYPSPRGKAVVTSDENGLFGFETLAFDSYWIEIHEKGYLPLLEKRTTGSVERIERKIKRTDASDQVTIRLRPVPCIEGTVKTVGRNGQPGSGARWVDVQVAYQQRGVQEKIVTQTNALGEFFVNLPSGRRGSAKIAVPYRGSLGFARTRIPTRRPLEIKLERQTMNGSLFLSDGTPLAGVEISSRYLFPDNADPSQALRLTGPTAIVRYNGRFSLSLAPQEKVELVFQLPDGQAITKSFDTRELLRQHYTFVYDPLSQDIVFDAGRRP
jgi:hypothetical protein